MSNISRTPPTFEDVLEDIDSLFKVNRVVNALDILGEFNFLSSSATETITKIKKLSKLVVGTNVSKKEIFFSQKPSRNSFLKGVYKESDGRSFNEFKAALRQSFLPPPLILLLQLRVLTTKITTVGQGTPKTDLGTENDGMNL